MNAELLVTQLQVMDKSLKLTNLQLERIANSLNTIVNLIGAKIHIDNGAPLGSCDIPIGEQSCEKPDKPKPDYDTKIPEAQKVEL